MAEQLDLDFLRALKQKYPDHAVVAYINTTSELKTECDVCVTSSSAVEICKKLDADKILFIPDRTLVVMWHSSFRRKNLLFTPVDVRVI